MTDEQGGRSVLWHVPMSLDGFITGPGDAMHCARGAGPSPLGAETIPDRSSLPGQPRKEMSNERRSGRVDWGDRGWARGELNPHVLPDTRT